METLNRICGGCNSKPNINYKGELKLQQKSLLNAFCVRTIKLRAQTKMSANGSARLFLTGMYKVANIYLKLWNGSRLLLTAHHAP